ncbi:hypothetical protein [Thiomicrorhabdus sp. Milos-T2]|uniref:hypothetical protein n=1 Tax=Thiomicrorhabdus sp. Milos-T2 TaxID=90814 RepID=UPI00049402E7|nr:hypothetical protein [Thiomicrorhabdus sp. Milos-T2]
MNYLDFEYELYQYIFNEANCLWKSKQYSDIYPPSHFEQKGAKYLSYKIKAFFDISNIAGIESEIERLQKFYLEHYAGNTHKTKKMPERFPIIFDTNEHQIEQAQIRFENAFSSKKIKNINAIYNLGTVSRKELSRIQNKLKESNANIRIRSKHASEDSYEPPARDSDEFFCYLRKSELINQFGEDAQIRKKTGKRFKAIFKTNSDTIRTNAGFYLFHQSFDVQEIDFPLRKRATKEHRISIPGFSDIQISSPGL